MDITARFHDKNGVLVEYTGKLTPDITARFAEVYLANSRDKSLCDFGEWQCPFAAEMRYCGGMPPYNIKDTRLRYPYWILHERLSAPTDIPIDPQLPMFDAPRVYHQYAGHLSSKSHWWVSYWWCKAGLHQAIDTAKSEGHFFEVLEVTKKPRKRKVVKKVGVS